MIEFISKCDVADMFNDNVRFLSHIIILHVLSCFVDGKEQFFELSLLKSLLYTTISVIIYHLLIKNIFMNRTKKLKKECEESRIMS